MSAVGELKYHTAMLLHGLHHQFGDRFDSAYIDAVGQSHLERLVRDARVPNYIPLLVYRATRNELVATPEQPLRDAA
jgi:hypothetical protein